MQHRIQQYKIITSQDPAELEESINDHLKKGYELYGDPGAQNADGKSHFFQALVLRGDF